MRKGRRTILYSVLFNAGMCLLTLWLPLLAVSLTALAWIVYLIMGLRAHLPGGQHTSRRSRRLSARIIGV